MVITYKGGFTLHCVMSWTFSIFQNMILVHKWVLHSIDIKINNNIWFHVLSFITIKSVNTSLKVGRNQLRGICGNIMVFVLESVKLEVETRFNHEDVPIWARQHFTIRCSVNPPWEISRYTVYIVIFVYSVPITNTMVEFV